MLDDLLNPAAPTIKIVDTDASKAAASANGEQVYRVIVIDRD